MVSLCFEIFLANWNVKNTIQCLKCNSFKIVSAVSSKEDQVAATSFDNRATKKVKRGVLSTVTWCWRGRFSIYATYWINVMQNTIQQYHFKNMYLKNSGNITIRSLSYITMDSMFETFMNSNPHKYRILHGKCTRTVSAGLFRGWGVRGEGWGWVVGCEGWGWGVGGEGWRVRGEGWGWGAGGEGWGVRGEGEGWWWGMGLGMGGGGW